MPEGHVGASDGLGRPGCPKRPISHPRPRAGVIWLETGGAGESYLVSYPDGRPGSGAYGGSIGDGHRVDRQNHIQFCVIARFVLSENQQS